MNMAISIKSDEKGNIHPPEKFGIQPKEKLFVDVVNDMVVIRKANKEAGSKVAKILEKNLKDVNFNDIGKAREDREW